MPRTNTDQGLHDSMVRGMITALENEDITVLQADVAGYPQPDEIGNKRPDIIGQKQDNTRVIVEVETCSTINEDHTRDQFEAFSNAEGKFWVDVPESCLQQLKANARSWGTTVSRWFYRKGH